MMLGQGARLYWAIQWRRNEGLGALFLVLVMFAVIYAILFPGILAVGAMAKFVQGWFPTAMVAAAETIGLRGSCRVLLRSAFLAL